MNEADTITDYILAHLTQAKEWKRKNLRNWVIWAGGNGFLISILGDNHDIIGVVIARPIMRWLQSYDTLAYDPEGPIIFCDIMVCTHPFAIYAVASALRHRFGMRETVAFFRHAKDDGKRIRKYPCERFHGHLFSRFSIEKVLTKG